MIGDLLDNWLNSRGPEVLEWMYGMVPFMVIAAVATAVVVYWVIGFGWGSSSRVPGPSGRGER